MFDVYQKGREEFHEQHYDSNDVDACYIGEQTCYQMGMLAFKIFCVIPNFLIMINIGKHKLSTTTYSTIVQWSSLNLFWAAVPDQFIQKGHQPFSYYFICTCIGYSVLQSIGLLAMLLLFESYIKSERFCKNSLRTIWCFLYLNGSFFGIVLIFLNDTTQYSIYKLASLNIPSFICMAMFLINMLYWRQYSKEKSFYLRIKLSAIFMISLSFISLATITVELHKYYFLVSFLCTIVTNVNGLINLIVLIYSDLEFRKCFLQLFCKSIVYNNNYKINTVHLQTSSYEKLGA